MKMKDKRGLYKGRGVGERSFPLMAINWPLNGWLQKWGEFMEEVGNEGFCSRRQRR